MPEGFLTLAASISVAMCTFNGACFLPGQLESIAAQFRLPDELLICDDGSTDESTAIIREFAKHAKFSVRLVVNSANLGSTRNFEQAISLCSGSIVVLADQDDIWYPNKLEIMEKAFARSSSIVAAFSDAEVIDQDARPLGLRLWPTFAFTPAKQKRFANGRAFSVLIKHPVVTGATMAFRRQLFNLAVPIPANDLHDRWISFLLAARGLFEAIPIPLMQYRRHREQQIGTGPVSMSGQIVHAKNRGRNFYIEELVRFRQLQHRLEERKSSFPNADYALKEIEKKLAHLEYRTGLSKVKTERIPGLFREMFNGNYWRYSGGWRSIAKDLFIRE